MSTRAFLILIIVVAGLLGLFVYAHTPAGSSLHRSIRAALHGGD